MDALTAIQLLKKQLQNQKAKGFNVQYLQQQQDIVNAFIDCYNSYIEAVHMIQKIFKRALYYDIIANDRDDWHFLATSLGVDNAPYLYRVLATLLVLQEDYFRDSSNDRYYIWQKKQQQLQAARETEYYKQLYESTADQHDKELFRQLAILSDTQVKILHELINKTI